MNNLYYNDGFLCIEKKDNNTAFIASCLCNMYVEISIEVATYIIKKLKENIKNGYSMIDFIISNREKLNTINT